MPLSKYHIRNEHTLADPELYRAADKDDPEALLEAVAMAGLVGLLRQLGDLAEFAAEIFHDLHEEVMATAARGHSLMARVQQLEAEVPSLEKAFYSQTHHSSFYTNGGIDWHPNLRSEQNPVTHGDLPRFIMDSYEECRGPPRLFLLDKFDVAGAGACLKRYTDPSFFKMESASSGIATVEVHREKRTRKVKKKGARLRDGESPNIMPSHSKLHQLLLEERIENGYSDPARLVKLKKRQLNGSAVEAKAGKSYMEKFLETPSPDHKMICETSIIPLSVKLTSDDTSEAGIKILEISSINPVKKSLGNGNKCSAPNEQEVELKPFSEVDGKKIGDLVKEKEQIPAGVTGEISSDCPKLPNERELAVNEQKKIEGSLNWYHSDDVNSEVDNYMDALTTMESELETDNEWKPKNGFLIVQKVPDTGGKEEHHLKGRFSDSHSFGDSSTSDEISSFKQDRNEENTEVQGRFSDSHSTGTSSTSDSNSSFRRDGNEHIELQAHFSDSQSTENSSTSDGNSSFKKDKPYFTHSDSLNSMVENIQSEPMLFGYAKYCELEVKDIPSNQLPQIVEFQNTDCGKFVMQDDANVHKEEISGQASSDLMTTGHVLYSASPVTLPAGTESAETPSDRVEVNLRLEDDEGSTGLVESIAAKPVSLSLIKDDAYAVDSSDKKSLDNLDGDDPDVHSTDLLLEDDEGRTGLVESIAVTPVSLSIIKDDAYAVDSSDRKSLYNLDGDDPDVHSDILLQVSNDLESGHEDGCSADSEIKMLQADSPNKNSSKILVSRDIGSQGEDCIFPSMEELVNSDNMPALDNRESKDEDRILATELNLEDLSPVPQVSCFTGEVSSDLIQDSPHDEPGSVEIEASYPDLQSNSEEVPKMVHGKEISGSTCSVDPVEGDGCFKHPSSPDNLVMVNDAVTENAQTEDQAVFTVPSVDSAKNDTGIVTCPISGLISSPSRSLSNLEEPLSGSSDSSKIEMESNEVESDQISLDSNKERMENQLESSSDIICSPKNNLMKLEESLSTVVNPLEKEVDVNEAIARESLTGIEEQKIVDQPEMASADVQLNPNMSVPSDLPDSEICNNVQSFSPREQFQHSAFVDDEKMLPESSGLDTCHSECISNGQNDLLLNGQSSYSSPSCNQLESETDLELFIQSQVDEHDTEYLPGDKEIFVPEKSQSQQMQIYQSDKESTHATSVFASERHADESLLSCSLARSSGQEMNQTNHVMDPLKPLLPDFFPKETENNLNEMPPLPPLPPMQWRMGKVQHAFPVSQREDVEVNQASVQPMQPIKPDNKSQSGLPISERDNLLYQSPFLPIMAVESDKLQHSSGFSVGGSGHPVAIPFQFPVVVNDAKGQYNYVVLDRNQIHNPFLTLPVVSSGRPSHGYVVASEGEMVQNSSLCSPIPPAECAVLGHDSISPQEKVTQPPNQLTKETSSEVTTLQQSISNVVFMGRPSHGTVVSPEGEMVPSTNPCLSIPDAECAISGHDSISPQEKPTESSSQLMTDTSSEVKTLQLSLSNVASTGRPPCDYVVASEGEIAQNSNPLPSVAPAERSVSGDDSISPQEKPIQPPSQLMTETSSEKTINQSKNNVEGEQGHPSILLSSPPNLGSMEPNQSFLPSEGQMASYFDTSAQTSDVDSESTNAKPKNKLPRPRNPLIDAVVAHDKSKLRKVTERIMPDIAPKVDERDSLLEQIRTKSFNLKPAVTTRPCIQGPKTNLKLAAILEKANAIRQALAGSDEDDDADGWSDS